MHSDLHELGEADADCPYCGEALSLLLDPGDVGVEYTEDCQVCCRPMLVNLWQDTEGALRVILRREDD
jgi:hypothetical protein